MPPEFRPVGPKERDDYRAVLRRMPLASSDYSFVTLWAWREECGYEWATDPAAQGLFWIRETRPASLLYAPAGDWNRDWEPVLRRLWPEGAVFDHVPAPLALLWKRRLGARVVVENRRNLWEYVHRRSDLVDLPGNRFRTKKSRVRKFMESYDWTYEEISPETVEEILLMQEEWCRWRNCDGTPGLREENRAITHVLASWADLPGVTGGALKVGGKLAAYTIAEALTDDTVEIHFEKAFTHYAGVYQAINALFLERTAASFTWVNREEDLGDPGMREAKMSYHPASFIRKCRVTYLSE